MLKQDEINNQNSCLNKASDDEPIFVLRANDELAPQVVRAWARVYVQQKGDAITDQQKVKVTEAVQLAREMERWKRNQLGQLELDKFGHNWALTGEDPECTRCGVTKLSPMADRLCEPKL